MRSLFKLSGRHFKKIQTFCTSRVNFSKIVLFWPLLRQPYSGAKTKSLSLRHFVDPLGLCWRPARLLLLSGAVFDSLHAFLSKEDQPDN